MWNAQEDSGLLQPATCSHFPAKVGRGREPWTPSSRDQLHLAYRRPLVRSLWPPGGSLGLAHGPGSQGERCALVTCYSQGRCRTGLGPVRSCTMQFSASVSSPTTVGTMCCGRHTVSLCGPCSPADLCGLPGLAWPRSPVWPPHPSWPRLGPGASAPAGPVPAQVPRPPRLLPFSVDGRPVGSAPHQPWPGSPGATSAASCQGCAQDAGLTWPTGLGCWSFRREMKV